VSPWTLVEANNKYYARLKVLRTLADAVEAALDRIEKPRKGRAKKGGAGKKRK